MVRRGLAGALVALWSMLVVACNGQSGVDRALEASGGSAGTGVRAGCDVDGVHYAEGETVGKSCGAPVCENGGLSFPLILCNNDGGSSGVGSEATAGRNSAGAGRSGGTVAGDGGRAGASAAAGDDGRAGASAASGAGGDSGVGTNAGAGGVAGEAGSAGGDGVEACGDVTLLGRCTSGVYEWCDYFSGGMKRIDCGALGMQCRAEPHELGSDYPSAGCFGATCSSADEHCDGTLAYQCSPDGLTLHDCAKRFGPQTSCGPGQLGAATCAAPYCTPDTYVHCDGTVAVVCALDNNYYVEDCAEYDPAGTCTEIDPMRVDCGGNNIQPI